MTKLRLFLLVSVLIPLVLVLPAMLLSACGEPSPAVHDERQAVAAAIVEWRRADASLWLVPPDQVSLILEQGRAWDARRDAAEAEGRTVWVNIVKRETRPIKVDLVGYLAILQPCADRLDRVLTADSPLRHTMADLADWVDEYEQWGLNNPMTRMGDDPEQLELTTSVHVKMHDFDIERRLADGRIGVLAHLWQGSVCSNGRRFDVWSEWQVVLKRMGGRWLVENALQTGLNGDNDAASFGPQTMPGAFSGFEFDIDNGSGARLF
jgi:hypothetical protein